LRKTQRSKPVKSFGQRYVVGNPLVGGEYQSVCAEYENLASLLPLFASVFVETSARALRLSLRLLSGRCPVRESTTLWHGCWV